MGGATGVDIPPRTRVLRSRRLLRLAGDERLVEQIRRGSEAAFEVAFERHSPAILGYCRHMLGSPEEAEDAVQHTFAAAYGDLQRGGEREIALKPWLFTIARNRCLSMLRARREHAIEQPQLVTAGLAEQVEQRAELRQLLADVRDLPDEQRDALLLAELGALPQAEIASVLGCEVSRVKGLVYRARSALIARREARDLPCEHVREQLATLRGGALRRAELNLHLRECPGCRAFREDVRRQRQMLSVALPVAPTLGLKASVFAAAGLGAGAAGGGGATAAGLFGGASVVAKLAVTGALVVGGGTAVVVADREASSPPPSSPSRGAPASAESAPIAPAPGGAESSQPGVRAGAGNGRRAGAPRAPGRGRALGRGRGRGPIEAPPAQTPVRRGPPEGRGKPEATGPPPQAGARGGGQAQPRAQGKTKGRANPPASNAPTTPGSNGKAQAKTVPPSANGETDAEEPEPAGPPSEPPAAGGQRAGVPKP